MGLSNLHISTVKDHNCSDMHAHIMELVNKKREGSYTLCIYCKGSSLFGCYNGTELFDIAY